jgi:hypothetical protein
MARLQAHHAAQWLARAARAYVPPQPDDGRTDAQARQWLGEHLGARGLDARALDASSPYEMPAHAVTKGGAYGVEDVADALVELAAWFANAEHSLVRVQRQMIGRKLTVSDVRCWPHHFDLATLISFPTRGTDVTGYVGAGLSPGDEYYDEPYFYVSVYPKPHSASLPRLPTLGHWHTYEFTAAVAPAHQIVAANNQEDEVDEFLRGTVDVAIKILS